MTSVNLLGGAQTDFQRNWSKEGKGLTAMLRETIEDALQSLSLTYDDIARLNSENRVAAFIGNFDAEQYLNQGHLGAFFTEIDPSFIGMPAARFEAACASGSVAIDAAAAKIRAGDCDVALVVGLELMKTVSAKVGAGFLGTAAHYEAEARDVEFPFPKLFGQLADVILRKYHLDERRFMAALAEISSINYSNAKRNPKAQTRTWFMSREQALSRNSPNNATVGGLLCVTDCSQITDGAAAVVLTSDRYAEEYAVERALPPGSFPVLKGWGCRVAELRFAKKVDASHDSPYVLPWTRQAVVDALGRAGLPAEDIDCIETHDCFTSSEYAAISAFGLTEPGKEYEAVESGAIALDGATPVNPSGGLIGVGHPVGASGVRMLLDLYKQVAGTAGDYQVKNARNGAMLNIGGSATTNYAFVVGRR